MALTLLNYLNLLFLFTKYLLEILREHQRTINRAVRELEREKNKLQQQEKKLVLDIKRTAKQGQMVKNKKKKFV